jgi:UDP-glucose 4-epimerase
MLKHLNEKAIQPKRVVVLGSQGFVGSNILRQCSEEGMKVLGLSRKEVNLLDDNACEFLQNTLQPDDVLVIVSAIAPCKNSATLIDNLKMVQAVCLALEKSPVSQVVYISSDAVYADDVILGTESSTVEPSSLHGLMHAARELVLKLATAAARIPFVILRPSLLYGVGDPHNGYGPNRFRRLIEESKTITLFGEGEEKRDHIYIGDVAKIVSLVVQHRSTGVLNITTGLSPSFREIAETMVHGSGKAIDIQGTPRQNPLTHRHYDITACLTAFPHFHYMPFEKGVLQLLSKVVEAV